MDKIPKFLAWPYSKKKLLVQVFYLMVGFRIGLWVLPSRFFNTSLSDLELSDDTRKPDWKIISEVVAFVRFCSRFIPHATCLTQALTARTVLRRLGQNCSLKIGVDKDQDRKFLAHAWIVIDGKIIIGNVRDIRRYSIMSHNREQLV